MNLHITTKAHSLLLIIFLSPMLFAEVTSPLLQELLPKELLPFQVIEQANEAYDRGDYEESARLFSLIKSDDPSVAYDRANAYYKAKKYADALKAYAQAKGVDESTRLFNMGNCYFQKGDFTTAIRLYTNSLKLKANDDVTFNLKLARKKRSQKEKKKNQNKQDKKKEDKKKQEEEKKRKEEEEKKRKEEEKKRQEEEQKKKEQEKKDDKKKESSKKNSNSQKDADASNKQESERNMTPEEKMRKKELKHLLNQLSKEKMPTMMYQGKENKEKRDDKNPW